MTQIETALATTCAESPGSPQSSAGRHLDGAWVLADAAAGGARASHAAMRAIDAFTQSIERRNTSGSSGQERLRSALDAANLAIFEEGRRPLASSAASASIVAAVVTEQRLLLAHAGNARCYRFRADECALLTRPHTAVAAVGLDESTILATHNRHLITRGLGMAPRVDPELSEHLLLAGDLFLLVNDALSWAVEDRRVASRFPRNAGAASLASTICRRGERHETDGTVIAIDVVAVAEWPTASSSRGGSTR